MLETPGSYTVAWIAALPHERAAGEAMFDVEREESPPGFQKNASDPNAYSWGTMGRHNVVIASLPSGEYGLTSAATIAQGLRSSVPHIRIGLMVGIGAGVPGEEFDKDNKFIKFQRDIRLGDVAVSNPDGTNGGVVQFDFVKAKQSDSKEIRERKGFLNSPPMAIRTALSKLQARHERKDSKIPLLLSEAFQKNHKMVARYSHPGIDRDGVKGKDDVYHLQGGKETVRKARSTPEIHYGTIASSYVLEKSAHQRDAVLAWLKEENIEPICFEMEAAGLMNNFPCLVIRGICDYADSHKNDDWQRYAAATAAAFAKEFLEVVDADEIKRTPEIDKVLDKS
jgi:nucleoside phosphorylase